MRYVSTRGAAPAVGFCEAVLAGMAPDGGLYLPMTWPRLTPEAMTAKARKPYAEAAAEILAPFTAGEIEPDALVAMCAGAYAGFDHEAVAPLRQLGPNRFLLELFHGPSLAFKDVALQLLARLYEHILGSHGRRLTIVCATSGDTGGAAVEAFRGRAGVRLVTLFPEGRISEIQRRFMTTASEPNVRAVAVAGDFDDCQRIVKGLFADTAFAGEVGLSAVNSINIARILAQSVYYFTAAASLGGPSRPVSFAVPTGNFGDAYAGWAARQMGLTVGRILIATNANDILARAFQSGLYARERLIPTSSPAMDIQAASNFERLVFEAMDGDGASARRHFERFEESGETDLGPDLVRRLAEVFVAGAASQDEADAAMRRSIHEGGLVDPHTAVALAVAERAGELVEAPLVILSTAHPAKFPQAVRAATGQVPGIPPAAVRVGALTERFDRLNADSAEIKDYVRGFANS